MDLNDIRSLVTLLSFVLFLGLMVWTWWPAQRQAYADAERLPFAGDADDEPPTRVAERAKG